MFKHETLFALNESSCNACTKVAWLSTNMVRHSYILQMFYHSRRKDSSGLWQLHMFALTAAIQNHNNGWTLRRAVTVDWPSVSGRCQNEFAEQISSVPWEDGNWNGNRRRSFRTVFCNPGIIINLLLNHRPSLNTHVCTWGENYDVSASFFSACQCQPGCLLSFCSVCKYQRSVTL